MFNIETKTFSNDKKHVAWFIHLVDLQEYEGLRIKVKLSSSVNWFYVTKIFPKDVNLISSNWKAANFCIVVR